ncbi:MULTISPECIES: Hsp70 family protein [Catenuloplanes]|uniref:Hsp70 protein n=1 Tax=Catenuloplanes niger TaxID=587534 RepID=A0AAE3ZTH6_9ACTN|nr:Hsp70 family protein [Catenuloplanes niger]MDR7325411.1 hypothetical protein [Catenuloplanes niger]
MQLAIDLGTSTTVTMSGAPPQPLIMDSAVAVTADGTMLTGADALAAETVERHPKLRVADGVIRAGGRELPVGYTLGAILYAAGAGGRAVTLTHPAAWGPAQLAALTEAAAWAQISTVRLVPEPVAAAHHLLTTLGRPVPDLAVYDLGAGTFDVTVIRSGPAGPAIVATDGLADVSGLHLDAIVVGIAQRLTAGTSPDVWSRLTHPRTADDRRAQRDLWDAARAVKEQLSTQPAGWLRVPMLPAPVEIGRAAFEAEATPLLERTVALTAQTMQRSGVRVAAVLPVGGGARMPLVASLLHRALGIEPITLETPELVVAHGALAMPWPEVATAVPPVAVASPVPAAPPGSEAPAATAASVDSVAPEDFGPPAASAMSATPIVPAAPVVQATPEVPVAPVVPAAPVGAGPPAVPAAAPLPADGQQPFPPTSWQQPVSGPWQPAPDPWQQSVPGPWQQPAPTAWQQPVSGPWQPAPNPWQQPALWPAAPWQPVPGYPRIETIEIATGAGTGITLRWIDREPDEDGRGGTHEEPRFLAAGGRVQVFGTADGLLAYLHGDAAHDLCDRPGWAGFVRWVTPPVLFPAPEHRYELDLVTDNLAGGRDAWIPRLLLGAGTIARDLSYALDLDVWTLLAPGSLLDDFDEALRRNSRWKLRGFDPALLIQHWQQVIDELDDAIEHRP